MTPNPYDQASRYTAKLSPSGLVRWLLSRLAPTVTFRTWLDTRTIPFPGEPDRVCDTVAGLVDETAAGDAAWWALPIEFQRRPQEDMFGRLLEYLARLWRELRPPGFPQGRFGVGGAVINLTGTGHTSRNLQLGETGVRTVLAVAEVNLAEEDAGLTLDGIVAGNLDRCLLPWIPLMRRGQTEAIIEKWKVLALAEADTRRRADYGGLALVFAELTDCRPLWKQALEGWNVEQSQQVLEWQAEAEKRGAAKGKAEGKAESLLRLLTRKFSSEAIPAELETAIWTTTDLTKLDRWFDAAYNAASLDEFRSGAQL